MIVFIFFFFVIAALRSSVLSTSMHSWKLFSLPSSMSEGERLYFLFREPITPTKYRTQTCTQSLSVSHLEWPRMTSLFLSSPDPSGVYLVVSTWRSHSFFFLRNYRLGAWCHFDISLWCFSSFSLIYFHCWLHQANMASHYLLHLYILSLYSLYPYLLLIY